MQFDGLISQHAWVSGTRPDFVLHFRSSSRDSNVDGLPTPRKFPACMVTARILSESGILDTTWHPLDGIPAPDYVPPTWDGPHAGKRLVDGLKTLQLMPQPPRPRGPVNSWPAYAYDWADLLAQQESDEEQKAANQREQNRTRVRPSSVEIAHMEQSICWPARYLRSWPQLVRAVKAVAVARSRDDDTDAAARRLPAAVAGTLR